MDIDILTNLFYLTLIVCAVLAVLLVDERVKIARLKQKNYFLKRDKERYAETIYASKDGYFAFIYPDERIHDPHQGVIERCSRRLSVMLDLKNGKNASFEEVLEALYKEDARRLKKYLTLMKEDGIAFENTFQVKNTKKSMRIFGCRINGADGNLYCDMLWFRDLSPEQLKIGELEEILHNTNIKIDTLQDIFNHIDVPLYIRNEQLQITASNMAYQLLTGNQKDFKDALQKGSDILAQKALETNQPQERDLQTLISGQIRYYKLHEIPFHNADELDKIGTIGYLIDTTELDQIKRSFKIHQNAHLEVLSALGSAFAIFSTKYELVFCNKAFQDMWQLSAEQTDSKLMYTSFLNILHTKRLLPEVSDFKAYRADEEKLFTSLIVPKENLLHLPNGRTIRRIVTPHPNGIIFAYEDVSDKLSAERTIHELMRVQQNILDQSSDGILIFASDGRLRYFNDSYIKIFPSDKNALQNLPNAIEVFEMQKSYLAEVGDWESLKKSISKQIFDICAGFELKCNNGNVLFVNPYILADETFMVSYRKKTFDA